MLESLTLSWYIGKSINWTSHTCASRPLANAPSLIRVRFRATSLYPADLRALYLGSSLFFTRSTCASLSRRMIFRHSIRSDGFSKIIICLQMSTRCELSCGTCTQWDQRSLGLGEDNYQFFSNHDLIDSEYEQSIVLTVLF